MYIQIISFLRKDKRLAKCCQFAKKYREAEKYGSVCTNFFGEEKTKEEVEEIFVEALHHLVDFILIVDKDATIEIDYNKITDGAEITMKFYKDNEMDIFGDYFDYEQPDIRINGTYFIDTRVVHNENSFITSEFCKDLNSDLIINENTVIVGGAIVPNIHFHLLNQNLAHEFDTKLYPNA